MVEKLFYSMRDVCKALNMRKRRFLDLIENGLLPHGFPRGNSFYWTERDIRGMAWLEQNRHRFIVGEMKETTPQNLTFGHVYFVRQAITLNIKIGFSKNPEKRIANLQSANAEKLELIGTIQASKQEESLLHKRFAEHRLEGEWFSKDVLGEILQIINAEKQLAMN